MPSPAEGNDFPPEFKISCHCKGCAMAHAEDGCKNDGEWYVELHTVDLCEDYAGQSTTAIHCQWCFAAHVAAAKRTLSACLNGLRCPMCTGCWRPLVRLSNIIRDVAKI